MKTIPALRDIDTDAATSEEVSGDTARLVFGVQVKAASIPAYAPDVPNELDELAPLRERRRQLVEAQREAAGLAMEASQTGKSRGESDAPVVYTPGVRNEIDDLRRSASDDTSPQRERAAERAWKALRLGTLSGFAITLVSVYGLLVNDALGLAGMQLGAIIFCAANLIAGQRSPARVFLPTRVALVGLAAFVIVFLALVGAAL
jgi:hypothetical protein